MMHNLRLQATVPRRPGFTLIELMMVVSIIGLLAVIAIPHMRRARMRAQDSAFINDLRVISDSVLEQYAITTGNYPEDSNVREEPSGVADYKPRWFDWTEQTPIGGYWDWDRAATRGEEVHGCYAGLSVIEPQRTSIQMLDIDKRIDDGVLASGRFRGHTNGYIYVLED